MASEVIKTQEDNNKLYIQMSKTNIDTCIYNYKSRTHTHNTHTRA
jgi:hypothetical protein